jgi:hypothetical protein
MIRRFGFVVVLVSALIVAACGRQVTPNRNGAGPGGNLPSGFMQVKFDVAQPFNFQNYSYVVVFNTSGDGSTPRANGTQTAYQGYSFAIVVSGAGGSVSATPYFFQRPNGVQNAAPILLPVNAVAGQLQFNANSNGQNTEFTVLFNRVLASAYSTPTPSVSASPTVTPTLSPSPSPSTSPTGSPSPSPSPTAPNRVNTTWTFNYFVVQGSIQQGAVLVSGVPGGQTGTIVDSLGANPTGATDATYTSPSLDTTVTFDTGPVYPQPGTHSSDPSSQITSGDVSNNP